MKREKIWFFVVMSVLVLSAQYLHAALLKPGPFCGVRSVYAAVSFLGESPKSYRALISDRYLPSLDGSSADNITAAVQDCGCASQTYSGLNLNSVRGCEYPIIVHVKTNLRNYDYDHWIVIPPYGAGTEAVAMFDTSDGSLRHVAPVLFDAMWDGVGIIVTRPNTKNAEVHLQAIDWRAATTTGLLL